MVENKENGQHVSLSKLARLFGDPDWENNVRMATLESKTQYRVESQTSTLLAIWVRVQ